MQIAQNIRRDLPAGIVVFFVAVPLCLGIALASGAPLFAGLIAGIVGGTLVGAISGSALGVSGPAAGLAVIVFEAIRTLGSYETFLLAVVLSGVIQIGLGFARAGILGYFFPSAVIKGMLAGIGLLIILKQIPHAVGWDSDPEGDLSFSQPDGENTISELFLAFEHIEPSALLVSTIALLILVCWEKFLTPRGGLFSLLQGPLVAVAFGIFFQIGATLWAPGWALSPEHLVNVPVASDWGELLGLFTFPDFSKITEPAIYSTALTLALVASLETLLCVEATDKLDPEKRVTPPDRELFAQGAGNLLSGLIGGLPVTQVIVRSSANIQSGAASKLSAIIHGIFLAIFALALPQVLNLIPLAVLASILFVVGYKLAKPALFLDMFKKGFTQFGPFIVTIVAMIGTDLLTGVLLGLALAVLVLLHRNYQNSHFLHLESSQGENAEEQIRIQLSEEVTFLNRGTLLRQLADISDGSKVVIDASRCVSIDPDVTEIIDDFESTAERRRIQFTHIAPEMST